MSAVRMLSRSGRLLGSLFSQVWGVLLLLLIWQVWVDTTTPNSLIVVPPVDVLRDVVGEPLLYVKAAGWTVAIAMSGLVCGLMLGLMLAVLAWISDLVSGFLGPAAILISSTPVVCIIPLLARVFGYGLSTEFVTVLVMMFFPGFVFASTGLRNVPPMSVELLDTWNSPVRRRLWLLALPSAVPSLATALRAGAAASVLVAVVAEYLMQTGGLGALFAITMQQFNIQRAFGASIVAMLLSAVLYTMAGWVERWVREVVS